MKEEINKTEQLRSLFKDFEIGGELIEITELHRGHIHQTYIGVWSGKGHTGHRRYIHQRLNSAVFKDVPAILSNIDKVTNYADGFSLVPDRRPFLPKLVRTEDGALAVKEPGEGAFWRTMEYVERTEAFDFASRPIVAFQAGRAFGIFHRLFSDFPVGELATALPGWHATSSRLEQLNEVVKRDPLQRVSSVADELEFIHKRREWAEVIEPRIRTGEIPVRVTHNDTKLNNILFDQQSGETVAVVDLDLCMPGTVLYDFGDQIRTTVCRAAEDERDLKLVTLDPDLFVALVEGYAEGLQGLLTCEERRLLLFSGKIVTLNLVVRFLADYLNGDRYFKTERPGQNLDRARAQMALIQSIEENEVELEAVVRKIFDE